jgi:hypothetical protein
MTPFPFKLPRTGLLGSTRVDVQWWWEKMKRAERLERACRPPQLHNQPETSKQLRLPGVK